MVDNITNIEAQSLGTGFNIDNFVAKTVTGFKRPNRQLVRIPSLPSGFQGNKYLQTLQGAQQNLEWYCEGAAVPGVSVATHTGIRYGYGSAEKRPFMPVFNDINLSVLADDQDNNLYFFKEWLRIISNFDMSGTISTAANNNTNNVNNVPSSPFELAYRSEYVTDLQISLFDVTGSVSSVVRLREAFPVFVGDIQTNWGDNNNLMRIPVSISFVDWYWDYDAMRSGV